MAKFFGLVFGSQPEQPKALEVNVDTVYVRNNIERVVAKDEGEFEGWQYEETQYNLKEFQETVGKNTGILKVDVADVAEFASSIIEDSVAMAETMGELIEMNIMLAARLDELEAKLV